MDKSIILQDNYNKNIDHTHKIKIINLKRRVDRKEAMVKKLKENNIQQYDFIEAVDGMQLNPTKELNDLFKGNDFDSRRGFIGCALTHYNLFLSLLQDTHNDYYIIMEDDIIFCKDFDKKIIKLTEERIFDKIDLSLLGYSMYEKQRNKYKDIYDNSGSILNIQPYNKQLYIGGFFCYSINKLGAYKMVEYIKKNGIKHGIDYLIKIIPGLKIAELQPQMAFTKWQETTIAIDTDIQNNYSPLIYKRLDNEFIFIQGVDQCNCDVDFHSNSSLTEKFEKAYYNNNCIGFNTLGYFKSQIIELKSSQWFSKKDGIYIKKTYWEKIKDKYIKQKKYKIKMIGDWCDSKTLCSEWKNMCEAGLTWKNIEITHEDDNIDYYVIINKPIGNSKYIPEKTILFQMEPWIDDLSKNWGVKTWGEWASPDEKKFLYVGNHKKSLNNVQWWVDNKTLTIPETRKDKIISILSQKNFDEGHIKRIEFSKNELIDVFGRENYHNLDNYIGRLKNDKKDSELVNYKYCLSIENNSEHNYATEKLWDGIMAECLCFYWGCPNLEEYIDSKAFVRLPLEDMEKSLQIIKKAIEEDLWSQRMNIIRKEKDKLLNKLGFFPNLLSIINTNEEKNNLKGNIIL